MNAKFFLILLAAALIGGGAALVVRQRGANDKTLVIAGTRELDLGIVKFSGSETVVDHVYELTNNSKRSLNPIRLSMSCGCLDGTFDIAPWPSGETRRLSLSMTLRDFGRSSATATIVCDDGLLVPVVLTATGCPTNSLKFVEGSTHIDADGDASFVVRLLVLEDNGPPPTPILTIGAGCSAVFDGWARESNALPDEGVPARYRGAVTIAVPTDIERTLVRVSVGDATIERQVFR